MANKTIQTQNRKWKLYRFNGEEDMLRGTFRTKNEAINFAKEYDRICDQDTGGFRFNPRFKVWSNDVMNEDWQITQYELPSIEGCPTCKQKECKGCTKRTDLLDD